MTHELREYVETHKLDQVMVRHVIEMLPENDQELDALIGQAVEEGDVIGFTAVITAALVAERPVDGRHLREGACLMPHGQYLAQTFWHMGGDKLDALVHALCHQVIESQTQIFGLVAAAAWCRKHGDGTWPPDLLRAARQTARRKLRPDQPKPLLYALTAYLDDPDFTFLVSEQQGKVPHLEQMRDKGVDLVEALCALFQAPIIGLVPETSHVIGVGTHLKRSLPKLGRNEICHCGSGNKYKRCCYDKDMERSRFITPVAGKTPAELEASREPHLTPENLKTLTRGQVRRLDPMKIRDDILPWYFLILGSHGLFERAAEVFEKLGWRPEMAHYEDAWDNVLGFATMKGAASELERVIRVRYPDGQVPQGVLDPGMELLHQMSDPACYLDKLNELALEALRCADAKRQQALAFGFLTPKYPALALLMAQGLLPVISKKSAMSVLQMMQHLRDQLLLPAEDPFAEILERRFAEAAASLQGKDAEKLREANDRLQVKSSEMREAKEEMERLRRELRLREKAEQRAAAKDSAPLSDAEREVTRALRQKVETQQGIISEYAQERAQMREAQAAAYSELQELRKQQPATANATEATDQQDDEALLLPAMMESNHPLRLLEYPKKFHETLTALPRHVSRAAQVLLGRLSAGEPSAFVGIVALRARPDTLRLRVGSDHRLIFRLHSATLEVVDLINRRDLDRCVKGL